MQKKSSTALLDTKPHYDLLDGLRGVAAVLVVWYHIFEAFATSPYLISDLIMDIWRSISFLFCRGLLSAMLMMIVGK